MKHQRHTFCCFKQCLDLKVAGIKNIQKYYDIGSCPHVKNKNGFSEHTYIKNNPRLINEIPRGTKRFKMIQRYWSASKRADSTIKEDIKVITTSWGSPHLSRYNDSGIQDASISKSHAYLFSYGETSIFCYAHKMVH